MKKSFLSFVMSGLGALPLAADPVTLTGTIGTFAIQAEVSRDGETLVGRYKYEGRDAWLDLSGEAFGQDAVQMAETVDGETTGAFYLDAMDSGFEGVWVAGETEYPVSLTSSNGDIADLLEPAAVPDVNGDITGQYFVGRHWVNGLFAPNYEIAFNGGTVNVVKVSDNSIFVRFNFLVGPTYHFASFRGMAKQTGEGVFTHSQALWGGTDPCVLIFEFSDATLTITDENNRMACGFGARAHANFELSKVDDTAEFGSEW